MNIALAQINVHVGNFDANLVKMLEYTAKAKAQGADVVVFPELATVGYPPRDFLEFDDFVEKAEAVIQELAKAADGVLTSWRRAGYKMYSIRPCSRPTISLMNTATLSLHMNGAWYAIWIRPSLLLSVKTAGM